jgi:phosphoribosyl-ATP pyrophosphohydrolase/phosphoribosyl-AMP cyclohydrolase
VIDPDALDWDKVEGMIPAIVQDRDGLVRMLGYMNREALEATLVTGLVTFFSRSRQALWVKGETSGNRLRLVAITPDCDRDALLITADPEGPTCHLGSTTCFDGAAPHFFPAGLEAIVAERASANPAESYTARLAAGGIKRIAQKVGEEGVEVALAATAGDREELIGEAADLAFHLTLLLNRAGSSWSEVAAELERRHRDRSSTADS